MKHNHAIEVRAQAVTIEGDKATPIPHMPKVAMVFYVDPPTDPLLIQQLGKFQTGHQLNSMARPLELLVQETAHAALGKPRILSREDAEAIGAAAVEVSEDALVPDGVESTGTRWAFSGGARGSIHLEEDPRGGRRVVINGSLPQDLLAPFLAAQIFLAQHGRLPFIGGGKMV